ncbi:MAG: hypothetical protein PHD97_10505 [Bacteroidales bacterium]|nr:hypothetical protein [Bacteroidales bacterium]
MRTKFNIISLSVMLFILFAYSNVVFSQDMSKYKVLSKIETFKAPPFPSLGYITMDTYDYRVKDSAIVPKTLTDVLICDFYSVMSTQISQKESTKKKFSETDVEKVINYYRKTEWSKIAGYRPWAHSCFLKGLTKDELEIIITEMVDYVSRYGVRDVD